MSWLFGYGSLIWRPALRYRERRPGYIAGWSRRFWQKSPDHRGTPERPGRVVTLVPRPRERCWGMAYQVEPAELDSILAGLDHREQAGYQRVVERVSLNGGEQIEALMYVAGPDNPNFTGEQPLEEIVSVVASSSGPSGSNREYLLELAASLRTMGADDPHVFTLEQRLIGHLRRNVD